VAIPVYYVPFDWRRTKFCIDRPTITITDQHIDPVVVSLTNSYFLPIEQIGNIILLRDRLRDAVRLGSYQLFGCYEQDSHQFRGLVTVFAHTADLVRFHQACQAAIAAAHDPLAL
jgi:hypothetical protein